MPKHLEQPPGVGPSVTVGSFVGVPGAGATGPGVTGPGCAAGIMIILLLDPGLKGLQGTIANTPVYIGSSELHWHDAESHR